MPPIPFWVAATITPEASAKPGLAVAITVPQPTWVDSELVYTVTQTCGDTVVEVSPTVTVTGGDAVLTVGDLVEGEQYTFEITASEGSLSVTSLPTAAITAIRT